MTTAPPTAPAPVAPAEPTALCGNKPGSVLVVIPTYNEAADLEAVVTRLHTSTPDAEVLVVDDDSPDGTGQLAEDLAAWDRRLHVLHRSHKDGLATAYLTGFRWGVQMGFDVLVQMDADQSHRPEDLPRLLAALTAADLVVGSRWVEGGRTRNWPLLRRLISRGGSVYARMALGLDVSDVTGGFHALRSSALPAMGIDTISSHGYCFQIDLVRRATEAGLRVIEVPITFVERQHGRSKMGIAIVAEALWRVTQWGLERRRLWLRQHLARSH